MTIDVRATIGSITMYSHPSVTKNFYLLLNPDELLSQLKVDQNSVKKQAGHGVEAGLPSYGPRTLPFAVEIHAEDYETLLVMEKALEDELILPFYSSYSGDDGSKLIQIQAERGDLKQIYAVPVDRIQSTIIPDRRQNRRSYTFAMFAEDPIMYAQSLDTESGPESFTTTTFTFQDGGLPEFKDGNLPTIQDDTGADMEVTNDGNIGSSPTFTISGPTENPTVGNSTTGKQIALTKNGGVTLDEGETVTIDVAAQTITKTNGAGTETDVSGAFSDTSQWFTIEPGVNQITLFDDTPGELSGQLSISFRDAWV